MKSLEDMSVPELLDHTRKSDEKAKLLDTLLGNPATRKETLKLVKVGSPSTPIPEIDAEAAADRAVAEERKERLALETRVRDSEIRERIGKERQRVMKAHGLTEDDMLEVEKIMTDETAPIPHYDAAAKVFKAQKSQATPTSANIAPPTFDMPAKDIWKGGIGNKAELNKIAVKEGYRALNEILAGNSAGR